jgi:hypothetical protein
VVRLRVSWVGLAYFLLILQLPLPYLIQLQPWRPDPIWYWPMVKPLAHLTCSLLGFLFAFLGWRFSSARRSGQIAMVFHGAVLVLLVLWALGMYYIVRGTR